MSRDLALRSPDRAPSGATHRPEGWWVALPRVAEVGFLTAALVLLAVIPFENAVLVGPASVSRVAAALAALALICHVALSRRLVLDLTTTMLLLAFLGWATLSFFWTPAPDATLLYLSIIGQLVVLVLIVWQLCTTPQRLRLALAALAVGGSIGGVMTLASTAAVHGGVPRYGVGDPNEFGVTLALTFAFTLHLAQHSSRWWWTLLWGVLALIQVLAILRTASRTAAAAAVIVVLVLFAARSSLSLRGLTAILGLCAAAYWLASRTIGTDALTRIGSLGDEVGSGDFNNRGDKWALAWEYFSDRPVTGIGGGAYRQASGAEGIGTVAHSVPLGLMAEIGLIGLLLAVAMGAVAVSRVARVSTPGVRRAMLAAGLCWLCGALTLTLEIRKITWVLLALATCNAMAVAREQHASRSATSPVGATARTR